MMHYSHLDGAGPGIRLDGGGGDEEDGDGGCQGEGPTHCHATLPHDVRWIPSLESVSMNTALVDFANEVYQRLRGTDFFGVSLSEQARFDPSNEMMLGRSRPDFLLPLDGDSADSGGDGGTRAGGRRRTKAALARCQSDRRRRRRTQGGRRTSLQVFDGES